MTISDIVANIDRRLGELQSELAQLTSARAALLNGAPSAATPASAPLRRSTASRRRTPSRPARRTFEVVPAGKIVALLAGSDGMRTRELCDATNGELGQVLALLKEQEHAGQVRRSGTRAATRWHLVTDEERIAARVAELRAAPQPSRSGKR